MLSSLLLDVDNFCSGSLARRFGCLLGRIGGPEGAEGAEGVVVEIVVVVVVVVVSDFFTAAAVQKEDGKRPHVINPVVSLWTIPMSQSSFL
jgi:hypothetical protein